MSHWLVTGGAGFIGSHLADALVARGDRVRVLDNLDTGKPENLPHGVELMRGDVGEAADVKAALEGVDGCFHLAAIASVARSTHDWAACHRTNLTGAINVLEASAADRRPVVYASSAAVYGDLAACPISEDAPLRPVSAYGADKLGCEQHARVAAHVFGASSVGLRFFNVYGPRQDAGSPYSGAIAQFAWRALADEPITIFGTGEQVRDFVFVGDAVAHLRAAMEWLRQQASGTAEVVNVCTGQGTKILNLAQTVQRLAGSSASIEFEPPRVGDISRSVGNPAHAAATLALCCQTDLRTGLAYLLDRAVQSSPDAARGRQPT